MRFALAFGSCRLRHGTLKTCCILGQAVFSLSVGEVRDLPEPIEFELPLTAPAAEDIACGWWDEGAGGWRGDGYRGCDYHFSAVKPRPASGLERKDMSPPRPPAEDP